MKNNYNYYSGELCEMVKHTVCFKLKKGESAKEAVDLLKTMKGKVPEVLDLEAGEDFLHSERSYDVILTVTLKDREALESYQKDPYHCEVIKKHMHKVRESSIAVDIEI